MTSIFPSYQLPSIMVFKLVFLVLLLSVTNLIATPSSVVDPPILQRAPPNLATAQHNLAPAQPNLATAPPNLATAPPNLATHLPNLATAPPNLVTAPPNPATAPPNLATAPPNLATHLPNLATSPPNLAPALPNLATAPPNLATAPPNLATHLPNLATAPPNLATAPPNPATAPPNLATAPPNLETAPPTNVVRPLCLASVDVCETSLYLKDATAGINVDPHLLADGIPKRVKVYNDSLPGPPIVVYEGQQIVVKVVNGLLQESTTVHWHGLNQFRTPWMDGADGVSHCPILPGQSFTYRFLAYPSGTHWYHAHHGTQRTMGAAGPLIILPRTHERQQELRGSDPLPTFDDEFILTVSDWMRNTSVDVNLMVQYEMVSYPFGYGGAYCFNSTKQGDGMDCGVFPYMSGLINGKGRHYLKGSKVVNSQLENFRVNAGGKYRFRVICTSMTFSFRLSIDNHDLHIIASDGGDVITTKVESLIIASGERYDFWIDASDPIGTGSYWIRAETLERFQNGEPVSPNHIEAVLQYGDTAGDPTTSRQLCTPTLPCTVLNCPYRFSLPRDHMTCLHVTDLRATSLSTALVAEPDNFVQHFLNFHFVGMKTRGAWKPSINGYMNQLPITPYQLGGQVDKPCNTSLCDFDECRCPHVLHLPLDSVVQLVLAITVSNPVGVLNGNSHPVHIHGQQVQVIKVGFPSYDPDTNFFSKRSTDLECMTESCNALRWTDPSWRLGNVSGAITEAPPNKDTIAIPVGGYVVVRFRANNPGYWYMHCHVEFHNSDGMALIIREGEDSDMALPPDGLPRCQHFYFYDNEENEHDEQTTPGEAETRAVSFYMTTTMALLVLLLVLMVYFVWERRVTRTRTKSING